jgi:hypothetical protein
MTPEFACAIFDRLLPGWREAPLVSGQRRILCSLHADTRPSLDIDDGRGVWICRAGCGGGGAIELARRMLGDEETRTLLRELGTEHSASEPKRLRPTTGRVDVVGPPTERQVAALVRTRRVVSAGDLTSIGAVSVRVWDDEWIGVPTLAGGWKLWAVDESGRPRLDNGKLVRRNVGPASLVTSPAVRAAMTERRAIAHRLWDVEGESDLLSLVACNAEALAITATVGAGSLAGHDRHRDALEALAPADVIVVRDRDHAGTEGARKAVAWWRALGVRVRVIKLPNELGDGGDLRDFLLGRPARNGSVEAAPLGTFADLDALADAASEPDSVTNDWGALVPLDHTRELPTVPLDVLPCWLRDMAAALARAYQVPPELPAMYALALASGALAGRFFVVVRPGWRMPPTLYVLVALPPSERKSPVINALAEPLRAWERERAVAIAEERRAALVRVEQARARTDAALKALTRAAEKGEPEPLAVAHTEAARMLADAEAVVPAEARLIVEYATPEALAERMADNGDRQMIVSDEGAGVLAMTGRYSRWGGADLDLLLRGYDGMPYTPARITRTVRPMQAATLAIALAAQPAAIVEMLRAAPEIRERGLLARMLVLVPTPRIGSRRVRAEPVATATIAEYDRRMRMLLDVPDLFVDGRLAPRELRLSPAADDMIAGLEQRLEPDLGRGGRYERIAPAAAKLAGAAARIAAVLHVADHAGNALPTEIAAPTVARALRIAEVCLPHLEALEDALAAPPELEGARRIAEWLRHEGRAVVTEREILRATRGTTTLATAKQRDAALDLLAHHGYIRRCSSPPDATDRGGRTSRRWTINPEWLAARTHGQNGHEPRNASVDRGSVHFVHVDINAAAACDPDRPQMLRGQL